MRRLALVILVVSLSSFALAQTEPLSIPSQATEVSPAAKPVLNQVQYIPPQPGQLYYSVVIENLTGGIIRVIDPPAQFLLSRPGDDIGTVLKPASTLALGPSHSSRDFQQEHVSGSAVHGLRLTLMPQDANGDAGVLDILPLERHFQAPDGSFEQPQPCAIYTDITAGHGCFGGRYPLIPGNSVGVYRQGQPVNFDDGDTSLAVGDIIIIEVRGPRPLQGSAGSTLSPWPQRLEIENRVDGNAMLYQAGEAEELVGTVVQALTGMERCGEITYCQPGSIREASCELLELTCLPTSPLGLMRIAPNRLQASATVGDTSQWMLTTTNSSGAWGDSTCFLKYLYPQSGLDAPRLLPRLQVSVQIAGAEDWVPLGAIVVPEVLNQVAAFRFEWLPQSEEEGSMIDARTDSMPEPPADAPGLRY